MVSPVSLASPEQFRAVFNAIGAAMMIIEVRGEDLHYAFLNEEAESFFGISNEQYAGKKIDFYHGADNARRERRQRTIAAYRHCVETGESVELEQEHFRPDGELRWGHHTISPIRDGDSISRIVVTSIDVTDLVATRKRLDEALTRTLSGFVTICAQCKDVRNDDQWVSIEEYASRQMNYRSFSHGLCPRCVTLQE